MDRSGTKRIVRERPSIPEVVTLRRSARLLKKYGVHKFTNVQDLGGTVTKEETAGEEETDSNDLVIIEEGSKSQQITPAAAPPSVQDEDKTKMAVDESYKEPTDQTNKTALLASRRSQEETKKEEDKPQKRFGYGPCKRCGRMGKLETKKEEDDDETADIQVFRVIVQECRYHCVFCKYWTDFPIALGRHKNKEHPHRCDQHSVEFTSKDEAHMHVCVTHGIKPSSCAMCYSSYATEKGFENHCHTQGHRSRDALLNRTFGILKKMDMLPKDLPFGAEDTRLTQHDGKIFDKVSKDLLNTADNINDVVKIHEIPMLKQLNKYLREERQQAKLDKGKEAVEVAPLTPPRSTEPVAVEPGNLVMGIMAGMSPSSRREMAHMLEDNDGHTQQDMPSMMDWTVTDSVDGYEPQGWPLLHSGSETSAGDSYAEVDANQDMDNILDELIQEQQPEIVQEVRPGDGFDQDPWAPNQCDVFDL